MSSIVKKLKNQKRTQILAENLVLDELVDKNILKELKRKFAKEGEVVTSSIRFFIVPKEDKKKIAKFVNVIALEHPSAGHFKNKIVLITSNSNLILEKFLK